MKQEEQHERETGREKESENTGGGAKTKPGSCCQMPPSRQAERPDKPNPGIPLDAHVRAGDRGAASRRRLLLSTSPNFGLAKGREQSRKEAK